MLNDIEGFIFDLDGTVYRGEKLLSGAETVIETLRKAGKKIVFLSNKPIQRRTAYADKLCRLGIPVETSQIINSSLVTARFLSENHPNATVYVVGEKPLVDELESHGISVSSDPEKIDYVIASFDRNFNYEKLNIAYRAIKSGARLIATNSDRTCPVAGGEVPDAAGMIGAIEGVTGKQVEMIAGKPSSYMLQSALDILQVGNDACLLVGDRLETDMTMALNNGIRAVLVLTGVTTRDDLRDSSTKPDHVIETLEDFHVPLKDLN